jgi:WD40 repeat protein
MTKLVPKLHYRAKTKQISDIVWSSDGEHLAIISRQDQLLEIIQSRRAHQVSHGVHGMSINSVVWSPENTFIALGGGEALGEAESTMRIRRRSGVLVLDVNKQQVVRTFATPEVVSSLAWSPHNTFMSIAARDVIVWEVEQNKEISKIRAKDGLAARYVGWFQDSRHILVAWSARRQEIERTFTIHEAATGKHISSIEVDKSPRERREPLRSAMGIRSLALAPMGTSIAVSGVCLAVEDDPEAPLVGIISLIDLVTGQERQLAAGIFGRIRWGPFTESISWSHDARFVAAFGWLQSSDTFIILDVTTSNVVVDFTVEGEQQLEPVAKQNSPSVRALAWSPVDYRLAVATSEACRTYQAQE